MYKILRNILFLFPTESVHHFSMRMLKILCKWRLTKKMVTAACRPSGSVAKRGKSPETEEPLRQGLEREFFGLRFKNLVGLGAGFDKNALYLDELESLGFGFVEIGTVTPLPQAGNEQPRLFRLPMDQALINRMGFNNDGAAVIADRLKAWRVAQASRSGGKNPKDRNASIPLIVGGNIGKNKSTPNEEAWKDYEICFRTLFGQVDYFVVNVSSPNTPGLRELQGAEALRRILVNLQNVNRELAEKFKIRPRPLLLKIAPDLNGTQLDEVIALVLEIRLDGLVAANTSTGREKLLTPAAKVENIGAGGLSGAPIKERATAVIRYIQGKTGGSIPLIASGGIFTGADAKEKIQAGASLVQVWTGFIYEGPMIVSRICEEL